MFEMERWENFLTYIRLKTQNIISYNAIISITETTRNKRALSTIRKKIKKKYLLLAI